MMRHAKSSWKDPALRDHERPLNRRGRGDAPRMGAWLADMGWTPDLVVLSDSQRTRETWALMAPMLPREPTVHERPGFYHAGLSAILADAATWPESTRTVLALGHNPGWEDALARLSGCDEVMTTGNIALLEGRGSSWSSALGRPWHLVAFARPREI